MAKDIKEMSVKELEDKVRRLMDAGVPDEAEKYKAELSKRRGSSPAPAAAGAVTAADWAKAGSKFAREGLHLSEFWAGEWKTVNGSVAVKFKIIEEGEDYGKESEITAGIDQKSIWKFKEVCKALSIEPIFRNGILDVPAMFPLFAGKQGMTLWIKQKDIRPPEQGGKGGWFTKAVSVMPIGTTLPADEAPF